MAEVEKPSEILIQDNTDFPDTYTVSILDNNNNNRHLIFVDVVDSYSPVNEIKRWIGEIQKIHGKRNLIVSLSALCSQHFANGSHIPLRPKENKGEKPYELLQLCVGNRCLLAELDSHYPLPRILVDFLSDSKTVVVGVGIEKVAAKLEKEWEKERLRITNRVELREEAKKKFPGNKFEKSSLEKLAKVVLRGEVNYVKPNKVTWFDDTHDGLFSYELIQFASVEVFLACKMGSILLENSV